MHAAKPLLCSLVEAAKLLSVSRRTLEREIQRGRFPKPVKLGRRTMIRIHDLDTFVSPQGHSTPMAANHSGCLGLEPLSLEQIQRGEERFQKAMEQLGRKGP
ncbi:helix-turn-helix transcriptional regulator [Nibricoccus sp. IMCC34717]|uniref:helix-turn-helix transcriptional regulator n=1 Tax=Nibricoccus sp. IMCC34717 TaxID=3034021 RepID=UPI00384DC7FB